MTHFKVYCVGKTLAIMIFSSYKNGNGDNWPLAHNNNVFPINAGETLWYENHTYQNQTL